VTKLDIASIQELLDAAEAGDDGPVFGSFGENITVENGPGAGPWRHAEGRDEFANVLLECSALSDGTFRQHGRCIYADDRVVINLIEESGSTAAGLKRTFSGAHRGGAGAASSKVPDRVTRA
jgi:hypothetical protein